MITMLNFDCMEFMRGQPDGAFDLAIVDPPYGNKGHDAMHKVSAENTRKAERGVYKPFDNSAPDAEYFRELFRISKEQIIWGANFFGIPGGYICWQKNGSVFGEAELAFCSMQKQINVFEFTWNGMIQGDMANKETRIHPTQKPVALYKWLLTRYAKPGQTILDTHGGSGSICIAAHDLGFDLMWMELDADYYAAAVKRYQTHASQLDLIAPEVEKLVKQGELL